MSLWPLRAMQLSWTQHTQHDGTFTLSTVVPTSVEHRSISSEFRRWVEVMPNSSKYFSRIFRWLSENTTPPVSTVCICTVGSRSSIQLNFSYLNVHLANPPIMIFIDSLVCIKWKDHHITCTFKQYCLLVFQLSKHQLVPTCSDKLPNNRYFGVH